MLVFPRWFSRWFSVALVGCTAALWLAIAAPAGATGLYELPDSGDDLWVLDEGNVLSRVTESELRGDLAALAEATGDRVQFVTVRRLDYGETVESLARELFDAWYPDEADRQGHALMLLDVLTNNAAIVLGSGLGDRLSEAVAESVAGETLLAPIRDGSYNEGFVNAKDRLMAVLSGDPDPGPPQVAAAPSTAATFKSAEETDRGNATLIVVVLLVLATVIPMVTYFAYQGFS